MTRKRESGTCRICGLSGPLTFDHVPPRSAFNNRPILWTAGTDVLVRDSLDDIGAPSSSDAPAVIHCALDQIDPIISQTNCG